MSDPLPPRTGHSLSDHRLGDRHSRPHDHGSDTDHDHDDLEPLPLEENALWIQDNVWLTSVGIDVGSAGTQVLFSRLQLQRQSEELSSRYAVVSREALYRSPVALTPYTSGELIDAKKLGAIIDSAYAEAGLLPSGVDVGVVILTGEALRRENAEAIAALVASGGGDFVCATAGHHMEATLAAYGSGAAGLSQERGIRILNIDIGGGTTKFSLIDGGRVTTTAAIDVGGRLIVVGEGRRIVRLDPAGRRAAEALGYLRGIGDAVSVEEIALIADKMAGDIFAAVRRPLSAPVRALYLTEELPELGHVDGVMFSGGVAEFVYRREDRDFGDLGRLLGAAVRRRIDSGDLGWPLLPPGECIRATAIGASEHSVQLSGNTIYISNPRALLPRRGLQVLQPLCDGSDDIDPQNLARMIRTHLRRFDAGENEFVLALTWRGAASHVRLSAFAAGIVGGLEEQIAAGKPLYLVIDGDIANIIGHLLREEMKVANEILVIDGIALGDFDYIDIGRIRMPSLTVPVTVKSLVFSDSARAKSHHGHAGQHSSAHRHQHEEHGREHSHDHDDRAHHHGHE